MKEATTTTIRDVSKKFGISADVLRYYERAGMIPAVSRTAGGTRDYQDEDLRWVELTLCMRSAGLPVEVIAEYVRLTQLGSGTIPDRLSLLEKQREVLLEQQRQTSAALGRLDHKISVYQSALKTGTLNWN
ncbi:MerR family transcriptional regulator [Enterocloster clostridioformis]|nr:MerR family transcriptional regulator [Enterocloster clostridioformis]MCA5578506.1 MerR family transcriptional regulator [Enterocloster clostridioformis]